MLLIFFAELVSWAEAVCRSEVLSKPQYIMFPQENVFLGWREKAPRGAGMVNTGNSCYVNSTLQVRHLFLNRSAV